MGYNYGLVGVASVTGGTGQLISADTGAYISSSAVRVFDVASVSTGVTVSLYAGTITTAGGLILQMDKNNMFVHSDVGFKFIGGVWAIAVSATAGASTANNLATVNYIKEF